MKRMKKISVLFLMINILFGLKVFATNDENILNIKEQEYTNQYKQYLQMTDEEKANVIEPNKYDFDNNTSTINAMLSNDYISLKNYMTYLRTSNYSSKNKFSLKDVIAKNIEIRNQKQTSYCWAYASMSSLETNLAMRDLLNGKDENIYDFSERHMAYSKTSNFLDGQKNKYGISKSVTEGGNYYMAVSYLTNGIGAVLEEDMPFENNEDKIDISEIQNKTVQTTVNDTIYFNMIEKTSKANEEELHNLQKQMREHISSYGAIGAAIYMPEIDKDNEFFKFDTAGIYCNNSVSSANHTISIIGWDDSFSKDNFSTTPSGDGAWIARNSYGEDLINMTFEQIRQEMSSVLEKPLSQITDDMVTEEIEKYIAKNSNAKYDEETKTLSLKAGDNGIFYISYYDELVYSQLMGIIDSVNEKTYDNIYQVDEIGATRVLELENPLLKEVYLANVFERTVTTPEYITSVGMQVSHDGLTYEVYINVNDDDKSLDKLQKVELVEGDNITLTSGYHTLNFKTPYQLTGEKFTVVIKEIAPEDKPISFWVENKKDDENITSNPNESFVGINWLGSMQWVDIGDTSTEFCYGNLSMRAIVINSLDKTNKDDEEKHKIKGSNFDNATATLKKLELSSDSKNFTLIIQVTGIQVDELCDTYKHYFCLSSNYSKNEQDITNDAGTWQKQEDGTYALTLKVTSYDQLSEVTGSNVNVFIKEIASKGNDTVTTVSKPIELKISASDYEVNGGNKKIVAVNKDDTLSPNTLPKTGINIMLIGIAVISTVGIILYIKYRRLYDVK